MDVADHIVTGVWGDIDHDGRPDLYTVGYVNRQPGKKDYLFLNRGDHFEDAMPGIIAANDADHGVQWGDFDQDGDLDIALAANDPAGSHFLFRNELPDDVRRPSIQVLVLDERGLYTHAGAEVQVYRAGTNELLGVRPVDTGSGYKTQNAMPVHVALPDLAPVDVVVKTLSANGPRIHRFENVDPGSLQQKPFEIRVNKY